MHLLDLMICVLLVTGAAIGANRRFGRSLFDVIALIVALRLTPILSDRLAAAGLGIAPATVLAFGVLAALLLWGSTYLYGSTQWTFGNVDSSLGGLTGLAMGGVVAKLLVTVLVLHAGPSQGMPHEVATSTLGREFLTFETYNRFVQTMYNLGV